MPLEEKSAAARASAVGEMQNAFADALMDPDSSVPGFIAEASGPQGLRRFGIYRNNVHASLSAAIAARFPVVERLVGEEFFRAMGVLFVSRHPPRSPVLAEYGGDFAAFLEGFEPVEALPYLPDVARIEWQRNLSYHAADAESVGIGALAALDPSRLASARLAVHPAAGMVMSDYPAVSIWMTNAHDEEVRPLAANAGGEAVLITRPQLVTLMTPLAHGTAHLIENLGAGALLGEAVACAEAADESFDLPQALATIFEAGAIAALALDAET